MFFAFLILLLMDGAIGVLVWLAWRRVAEHMRNNPEAAKLVAEHVIAPLLTGNTDKPDVKKTKGCTLV